MDDNVLKRYTTTATRASEYVQYDQGGHRHTNSFLPSGPALSFYLSLTFHIHLLHFYHSSFMCTFLGEDRWLCTLLLQQGWRVEYNAASDAYTNSPQEFKEFYNQRRRWGPSTLANTLDLLHRLLFLLLLLLVLVLLMTVKIPPWPGTKI